MGLRDILKGRKNSGNASDDRLRLAREGAEAGDPAMQCILGTACLEGSGVPADKEEAVRWLSLSAEQGNAEAMRRLGSVYLGDSDPRAIPLLERASDLDDAGARCLLGRCLVRGGMVAADPARGRDLLQRSADQGDGDAMYELGKLSELDGEPRKAVSWYLKSARAGNGRGMLEMALATRSGEVIEEDPKMAAAWMLKAADAGVTEAMALMGCFYQDGYGVDKSYLNAVDMLQKAVERGSGLAMYRTGLAFEKGRGMRRSYRDALQFYEAAAENGYPDARAEADRVRGYLRNP